MSRRTTGGTLAAWLIIAAIVGFAGGAFFGVQAGSGEPAPQTTSSANNQGQTEKPKPSDEATTPAEDLTLEITPKKVKAGESGRFDIHVKLEPAEEGVALKIQRSLDDGENWEDAFDLALTTDANGEASTSAWSGRPGVNLMRVVSINDEDLKSNEFALTVTE